MKRRKITLLILAGENYAAEALLDAIIARKIIRWRFIRNERRFSNKLEKLIRRFAPYYNLMDRDIPLQFASLDFHSVQCYYDCYRGRIRTHGGF